MGDVLPKEQPPGYAIRFDRHTRRWNLRRDNGTEKKGFATRGDAVTFAYDELRSSRSTSAG